MARYKNYDFENRVALMRRANQELVNLEKTDAKGFKRQYNKVNKYLQQEVYGKRNKKMKKNKGKEVYRFYETKKETITYKDYQIALEFLESIDRIKREREQKKREKKLEKIQQKEKLKLERKLKREQEKIRKAELKELEKQVRIQMEARSREIAGDKSFQTLRERLRREKGLELKYEHWIEIRNMLNNGYHGRLYISSDQLIELAHNIMEEGEEEDLFEISSVDVLTNRQADIIEHYTGIRPFVPYTEEEIEQQKKKGHIQIGKPYTFRF